MEAVPSAHRRPGDGGLLWRTAGLSAFNFITGSNNLLDVGPVAEFIDVYARHRQVIASTAALALAAAPRDDLRRLPPDSAES